MKKQKTVTISKAEYEQKRRDRKRLKKIKVDLKPINKILSQIEND